MLWIIGLEKNPKHQVVIQIIDLDNGKYMQPKIIREAYYEDLINETILNICQHEPRRIIFDEFYGGKAFKKFITDLLEKMTKIKIGTDGTVSGYLSERVENKKTSEFIIK